MELNITRFFREATPMDYSASKAEIGQNAGADTWRAACDDSADYMVLDDDEKREAFREFVRSAGAWSEEEIAAWGDAELNALCIQWIAGDMREVPDVEMGPGMSDADWTTYQAHAESGVCSSRIFRGTDGEIYFYCGS